MEKLKGKLEFISLWKSIKLFTKQGNDNTNNGEIDLRDYYWKLFENLNGKKSTMDNLRNSIEIKRDELSKEVIKYENDKDRILILIKGKTSTSNIGAYLPGVLQNLNGRSIIVDISDNGIKISNDPDEKVFGLYYTRNNCCKIPDDKVKSVCKIGTNDCCIFCTSGADGFGCLKFDSYMARMLLDRHSKGEMRANRIGNCAILGRKETN